MIVFLTSNVWATDIFTPVLAVSDASYKSMECTVLNAGPATAPNVTISILLAGNGATSETMTLSIPGGGSRAVVETSLGSFNKFYCRVSGISKTVAKVSFCLRDAN